MGTPPPTGFCTGFVSVAAKKMRGTFYTPLDKNPCLYAPAGCGLSSYYFHRLFAYLWTGEKGFYLAIGGAIIEHSLAHIRTILQDHKFKCTLDDVSDDMTMISIQGPKRSQHLFCCGNGSES